VKFVSLKLRLQLGKVEGVIELYEDDAPQTAKLLQELLPIEKKARHAMECGREVYVILDDEVEIPDENQTIYQTVGDVVMYYKPAIFIDPEWPDYYNERPVLGWVYERDTAIRGISAPLATNVVGKIVSGLDLLRVEAPRMRREGFASMRLSLL
jgi:hypothetical protein